MSDIKDLLGQLLESNDSIYSLVGKVKSIDKAARTCEVIPIENDEDTIFDVRLQGSLGLSEGLVVFPKVDSLVVVTFLNNATGYIALQSEIEKVEIVTADNSITYSKDGLLIESVTEVVSATNSLLLDDTSTTIKSTLCELSVEGSQIVLKNALNEINVGAATIAVKAGISKVEVDPTGVTIQGVTGTLGLALTTLVDALMNMQVLDVVSQDPSIPAPPTLAQLAAVKVLLAGIIK